jgi:hypothetical protein
MSGYLFLIIFFISAFSLFFDFIKVVNSKYLFYLFIFLLIYIAGIKDEYTCHDTSNYINFFNSSVNLKDFFSIKIFVFEPGFQFITSLLKSFGFDFHVLFFLISSFSLLIYGKLIWKYSKYPFTSLFVYICVFYFTNEIIIIRFGLASALMLYSICSYSEGKYVKFIFFSILSFLFHYTALSCILFYLLFIISSKYRVLLLEILILLFLPLSFFNITILDLIIYIQKILPLFLQFAISKFTQYLTVQSSAGIKQVFMYLPFIYFFHNISNSDIQLKRFYEFFLFSIFFMIELNQASDFSRVGKMYITSIILFFPFLLKHVNKNLFPYLYSMIIIYSVYMFIRICFFNSGGFIYVNW